MFNYKLFKTEADLPLNKKFKQPQLNIKIEQELHKLLEEYEQVQDEVQTGLQGFQANFLRYRDPESVQVLREKSEIEVQYLQKTIVMMELKQLAESISRIAFRKRVKSAE